MLLSELSALPAPGSQEVSVPAANELQAVLLGPRRAGGQRVIHGIRGIGPRTLLPCTLLAGILGSGEDGGLLADMLVDVALAARLLGCQRGGGRQVAGGPRVGVGLEG